MNYKLVVIVFVLLVIIAIVVSVVHVDKDKELVGNDKDEHGCIGSAGYTWCEEKQTCLRIWEENCTELGAPCTAIEDCPPGAASCINGFCSQYDEHGCVPDGGYTWCEPKQKCLREWEESCE